MATTEESRRARRSVEEWRPSSTVKPVSHGIYATSVRKLALQMLGDRFRQGDGLEQLLLVWCHGRQA